MIDRIEITKLNHYEHHNSYLIRMGRCNIICDVPLDPQRILMEGSTVKHVTEPYKVSEVEKEDMSKKLILDKRHVPVNIHFILISNVEGFVGLPILCKYFDLSKTEIICTKPTYYFALCVIQNLQKKEHYLPLWEDDEIEQDPQSSDEQKFYNFDSSLRKNMHLLSFKEKLNFTFKDVTLEFSCFSSGYSLGSCNFLIKSNFVSLLIINKSCYHIKRYPSPFDMSCFEDADVVLFTTFMFHPNKCLKDIKLMKQIKESKKQQIIEEGMGKCQKEDKREIKTEREIKKERENNKNYKNKKDNEQVNNKNKNENKIEDTLINATQTEKEKSILGIYRTYTKFQLLYWEKIHLSIGRSYKDAIKKLCSIVVCAIRKKGCVLIPIDLYYMYFLEITEMIGVSISKYLSVEEQVTIYTVMTNINDVIYYAESCADWVDDTRKEKCCRTKLPEHPFSFNMMKRNNRLLVGDNVNDIANVFKYPCVCFIHDSSLRFFESSTILNKMLNDNKNSVIFIDTMYDPTVVLQNINLLRSEISIFYCPIWWQLNEFNILQIIYKNRKKKCEYIVPYELKSFFQKQEIEGTAEDLQKPAVEKSLNKLKHKHIHMSDKIGASHLASHLGNIGNYMVGEEGGYIIKTVARKLKRSSIEKLLKLQPVQRIEQSYNRTNEKTKKEIIEQMKKEINWNKVNYLSPYKKIDINFNDFSDLNETWKPIRFFCDHQMQLEKNLIKSEGVYFAKVNSQLTTSYIGDLLNAEDIHFAPNTFESKTDTNGKNDMKNKKIEEQIEPKIESKIEPKIDVRAQGEKTEKLEKKEKKTKNQEKMQEEEKKSKSDNSDKDKNLALLYGTLKPTTVKEYFLKEGHKPKDIEIFFGETENPSMWRIKIKSLEGEIICHGAYDIEVCTSNEMFRQQMKKMLFDLMDKF